MSKPVFTKTPVGTTPNQRRKTWCHTKPKNESKAASTPNPRGILKHGNLTDRRPRKKCSFLQHNKENLARAHVPVYGDLSGKSSPNSTATASEFTSVGNEEDVLTKSLAKCYEELRMSVSSQDEIIFNLDDIQRDNPNVLRYSLYWICRAKLAESVGDDERVACMIQQAFAFSAQPEELVQRYYDEYKSRRQTENKNEEESPMQQTTFRTRHKTPSRELSKLDGNIFNSSVVRFCLIDSTPVRNRRRSAPEKPVLTPVRRTTRWERCGIIHPKTIEENRMTVSSLDELSSQIRSSVVYKPNSLLPCSLDEEMKKLENIDEL